MTAVVYIRVSTTEQAQNLSLLTQQKACREFCARQGIAVDRVFEDAGASAKTTDRPNFQEMLTYCRARKGRVQFVVVYNVSRFARNAHDHAVVRAYLLGLGVSLRSVNEPITDDPVGRLTENMMSAIAQFDNDQKADRTKAGMRAALAQGRWTWQAPVGYINGNAKAGEPSLIQDADRGPLVRRAFELVASGSRTAAEALRILTALGFSTRKGRPLTPQTFGALLKNPIYAGFVNAPGLDIRDVRGDFAPLVKEELFNRVQRALRPSAVQISRRLDRPDFPLRRFVICDSCGTGLTGSAPKGRTKTYPYYHCRKCRGVSVRREDLEAQFLDLLSSLAPRPEFLALFRAIVLDVWRLRSASAGALRQDLEAKVADLKRRESLLDEAYLYDQRIDRSTYERQRDALRESVALVSMELQDAKLEEIDVEGILGFAEFAVTNAARLWTEASLEQKQRLQRVLFPLAVRLKDGKVGTSVTCFAFMQIQPIQPLKEGLASPTGFEPVF